MRIETDVSLRPYNTFGVEARAAHFARVTSIEELVGLVEDPRCRAMPRLVLGGGSNVLFTDDFDGLVIKVEIMGIEVLEPQAVSIGCASAPARTGTPRSSSCWSWACRAWRTSR